MGAGRGIFMAFEDLSFSEDIYRISNTTQKQPVNFDDVVIHTPVDDISFGILTVSVDMIESYETAIGSYIVVELKVPLHNWVKDIFPSIHNLEVTIANRKYKALFFETASMNPRDSNLDKLTRSQLETMGLINVKLQLVNREIEALRYINVGGIYRKTRLDELISSIIMQHSRKLSVDGRAGLTAVRTTAINNTRQYDNIVIPDGTRLIKLVDYLQENYGLYSAGAGFYIKDKLAYIFPIYNYKYKDSGKRRLQVFNTGKSTSILLPNTTYITDKVVSIVTGGSIKDIDSGDSKTMEYGNGVRFPETRSMMRKPIKLEGSDLEGIRHRMNTEILMDEREDNGNYANRSTDKNILISMTNIVKRKGVQLTLTWSSSDPYLLEPGMYADIIYDVDGSPTSVSATLLAAHTSYVQGSTPTTQLLFSHEPSRKSSQTS